MHRPAQRTAVAAARLVVVEVRCPSLASELLRQQREMRHDISLFDHLESLRPLPPKNHVHWHGPACVVRQIDLFKGKIACELFEQPRSEIKTCRFCPRCIKGAKAIHEQRSRGFRPCQDIKGQKEYLCVPEHVAMIIVPGQRPRADRHALVRRVDGAVQMVGSEPQGKLLSSTRAAANDVASKRSCSPLLRLCWKFGLQNAALPCVAIRYLKRYRLRSVVDLLHAGLGKFPHTLFPYETFALVTNEAGRRSDEIARDGWMVV